VDVTVPSVRGDPLAHQLPRRGAPQHLSGPTTADRFSRIHRDHGGGTALQVSSQLRGSTPPDAPAEDLL
jgi:hypothetical protein